MPRYPDSDFPPAASYDEREMLLRWLRYSRGAVIRKVEGLGEDEARWQPGGSLISLMGIVNHLTHVEWRWIDGEMLGHQTSRSEAEFRPGRELTVEGALTAYVSRADATDSTVRQLPLNRLSVSEHGADLRWVLIHLINETARHAGHADATRELLDGTVGES